MLCFLLPSRHLHFTQPVITVHIQNDPPPLHQCSHHIRRIYYSCQHEHAREGGRGRHCNQEGPCPLLFPTSRFARLHSHACHMIRLLAMNTQVASRIMHQTDVMAHVSFDPLSIIVRGGMETYSLHSQLLQHKLISFCY